MGVSGIGKPLPSIATRVALQLAGVALLVAVDLSFNPDQQPLVVQGVVDLPAHVLTAVILLAALRRRAFTPFWWSVTAWSALIDLDHIPGVLGWYFLTRGEPRPYTHSLLCIGLLWLWSLALRGRTRQLVFGAAIGVALHLVRDITDGAAVPLFWPVVTRGVSLPYPFYVLTLVLFVILGIWAAPADTDQPVQAAGASREIEAAASH
jgi:inner membrane protein